MPLNTRTPSCCDAVGERRRRVPLRTQSRMCGKIHSGVFAVLVLSVALVLGGAYWSVSMPDAPPRDAFAPELVTEGVVLDRALARAPAHVYLRDFALQETAASCGAASVRNVLVSVNHEALSERALFGSDLAGWLRMQVLGMTLERVAQLLTKQGVEAVTVVRDVDYAAFVEHLERSNDPAWRYIVNFDRAPLFGVPIGHLSPLGGYDSASGLVTVLDVTPGYGMSLVPAPLLYAATATRDPDSGLGRGLVAVHVGDDATAAPKSAAR